jgi:hypothetical protein
MFACYVTEAADAASPKDTIQIYPAPCVGKAAGIKDLTSRYDYDEIDRLENRYRGVSRAEFLRDVFAGGKGAMGGGDNEVAHGYFAYPMRHPLVKQPMYADHTMLTDTRAS